MLLRIYIYKRVPLHSSLCAASSKRVCFYYCVTNGGSKVNGVFDLTKLDRRLQSAEAVIDNPDCYLLDFHVRVCVCVNKIRTGGATCRFKRYEKYEYAHVVMSAYPKNTLKKTMANGRRRYERDDRKNGP